MRVTNWYLTFDGSEDDALYFLDCMKESRGMLPKALSDLLFALEVELQNAGVLDEDFNLVG